MGRISKTSSVKMRVLLTGASGFVGKAIAKRLLSDGHEVVAYVRDASSVEEIKSLGAQIETGGLGDPNRIAEAAEGCDHAIHAAGETSHRASPRALGWINVAGTENVLNAVQHAGARRLIYISCTDATLVPGPRVNWNEDRVLMRAPFDPHARTKLSAEELVLGGGGRGASRSGFETVVLRPALVWGAGDTSHLPRLCREALSSRGLPLFSKGDNLIGTTHVDNLADATLRALSAEEAGGCLFHVVDAELTLAQDFYQEISKAVGLPEPKRSLIGFRAELALAAARKRAGSKGPWPTDVVRRGQSASFDQQRAVEILEYKPMVSQDEGLSALQSWANEVGGAEQIVQWERPPATDDSVREQVAAASG